MPRPWEGKDLTEEKIADYYGPVAAQDGTTREQFYDAMIANGWTKEGDNDVIASLFWLGCRAQLKGGDNDFIKIAMSTPIKTEEDRNSILSKANSFPYANRLGLPKINMDIYDMHKDSIQRQIDLAKFRGELLENGFGILKNEKVLDVLFDFNKKQDSELSSNERIRLDKKKIPNKGFIIAKNLLSNVLTSAEGKDMLTEEQINILKGEIDNLDKATRQKAEEDIKREVKEAHLRNTFVLRKYLKAMINKGLDEMTITPTEFDEKWGLYGHEDTEITPALDKRRRNLRRAARNLLPNLLKILKDPENEAFVNAVKNDQSTDDISLNVNVQNLRISMKEDISTHNDVEQEKILNMLTKTASLGVQFTDDLLTFDNMQDPFWDNYSRVLTDADIKLLQDKVIAISEKGLNWDEFLNTDAYNSILRTCGFENAKSKNTPYNIASKSLQGREDIAEIKASLSVPEYDKIIKALDTIAQTYDEKKEKIMDMGEITLSHWFKDNGYDLLTNTVLANNGFEEVIVDGKPVKIINLTNEINEAMLDRDKLDLESYNKLVENAKAAQTLYGEIKNDLDKIYTASSAMQGRLGGEIVGNIINQNKLSDKALAKVNKFRHYIYEMQVADKDTCRLIDLKNNNKVVDVKPLAEDTVFNEQTIASEKEILDICYEMLREPSTRVSRNSREYMNVMESIQKLKDVLGKDYGDNEAARKAYVRAVNKVLNNITKYRIHKAKDGFKNDATLDKFVALERVDKLLRTRYQSIEQREYEDTIGDLASLFVVEPSDNKFGNDYLQEQAIGKIENMRRKIADIRAELEEEGKNKQSTIKRRNTIGYAPTADKKIKAELDGEEPVAKKKIMEAPDLTVKKVLPDPVVENPGVKAALDKEAAYRAKQDAENEYDADMLKSSAGKTLFIDSVVNLCRKDFSQLGEDTVQKNINKAMNDFKKASSIQYRRFKMMYLNDKDFNKEFETRVLNGAKEGHTSTEDIRTFRDQALTDCFLKYKGKNTADLDKLSKILGSKVNSKTVKPVEKKAQKTTEIKKK